MSTSEEAPGKLRISSPRGGLGGFIRSLLTLLVILAILLLTGVFAVRTEGGKVFVKDHLAKRLGMELSVGTVRIGWPYDLVVDEIESEGYGVDRAGFRCRELRAGLGGRAAFRFSLIAPELRLVKDVDARWMPGRFGRMGDVAMGNILAVSRLTETLRERVCLTIREGSIEWFDGATRSAAKGISFSLAPIDVPGREMYHYLLSVESAVDAAGTRALNVQREWLASETIEYLEVAASDAETAEPQSFFWEVSE